jgi:hypothetical protein
VTSWPGTPGASSSSRSQAPDEPPRGSWPTCWRARA